MPFILNTWNILINKVNPSNSDLYSLTDESIRDLINRSEEEEEKVRTVLIEGIIDKPNIRDKQQFVQVNQGLLIRLLDKIHSYKQANKLNDKILQLYDSISEHLEHTLDFIEDFFSNYFDRNEKVPAAYLLISIEELCRQLDILRQGLLVNKAIEAELRKVLINNFNKFCLRKKRGATYYELLYQKELMNELLSESALESETSVRETLFYLNFNDDNYVAYLYNNLKKLTESFPGKIQKIAALKFEQKNFNQLRTKLNCYLSANMPSLKVQINQWIDEEVKFLEGEERIANLSVTQPSFPLNEFVHLPFKGTEIYLLHKAFIDAGGATAETYKSLLEKTASHLSNKNQKGFSVESLQKNSDKVDYEAKENVKRFLTRMMRNLESY